MTTEDTTNPNTLGEVGVTLRFMQKAMDAQGVQLKEIGTKIDAISSNYVQLVDFAAFRHVVERDYGTKEEIVNLKFRYSIIEKIVYAGIALILVAFLFLVLAKTLGITPQIQL